MSVIEPRLMRIPIILFILAFLVSCKDSSPITITPEFGETFELRVGKSVTMATADLTILFKDVTEDVRCPRTFSCAWAGDAKLSVEFNNQPIEFNTQSIQEIVVGSYSIKLAKLEPYPEDDSGIPKGDYRASFIVTETPEFGETFELKIGGSVTMANSDVTILFKDVTEDGRCPKILYCTIEGEARLSVEFNNQPIEFNTHSMLEVVVEPYNIKLVKLDPYPEDDSGIPKGDYRASFIVTKTVE